MATKVVQLTARQTDAIRALGQGTRMFSYGGRYGFYRDGPRIPTLYPTLSTITSLQNRGLIEQVNMLRIGVPAEYCLTDLGRQAAQDIG
jgi:hypothetical protein